MPLSKAKERELHERLTDIVARLKAGQFQTAATLAAFYGNAHRSFTSKMRTQAIQRGLLTAEEWDACFTKPYTRVFRHRCRVCGAIGGPSR